MIVINRNFLQLALGCMTFFVQTYKNDQRLAWGEF